MSLSSFQRRLKEAQKGGERISKIVEDEAKLKQQLLDESAEQLQRLAEINDEFEQMKRGGQIGTPSGA